MRRLAVVVLVAWLLVGVAASHQRGDFHGGNCSRPADVAMVVIAGPINYLANDLIGGSCSYPT